MSIELEKINNPKIKEIYEYITKSDLKCEIGKTPYNNGFSDNSYQFKCGDETDKKIILEKTFKIKINNDLFKQITTGSGNEIQRITTLHSSSLCCLLFFHKIDENHILKLKINGEEIRCYKVFFEWENKVIANGGNSSVDVALLGKSINDKDVLLFIECKFSEYITDIGVCHPSEAYLKDELSECLYNDTVIENIGLTLDKTIKVYHNGKKTYKGFTIDRKNKGYTDGVKQTISHYMGIRNYINDHTSSETYSKLDEKLKNTIDKANNVYYATILFDFKNGNYLNDYETLYQNTVKEIKAIYDKIEFSNRVLTYNEVFKRENCDFIEENIRKFYRV